MAISAIALLSGCAGELHSSESALNPAGPAASRLSHLTWLFIAVCVVVYVIIMAILVGCFLHRRHGAAMVPGSTPIEPDHAGEARLWKPVIGGLVISVFTLFVLLIADFATGRSLHTLSQEGETIRVKVIAHQWWWEVQYLDWPERFGERAASNGVTTANEIHIPIDPKHPVSVVLELESHDVIHSFWVPNLQGKRDMIPGHPTTWTLRADRAGTYWGECAEYCGYQHANMRLAVVAEPVDRFQSWLTSQRQPAPEPAGESQSRGRAVFLNSSCPMCHSIGGTEARGIAAPNLTHVASRPMLAAGAVPNTPGYLAGWIVDPQRLKPGTQMPQNNLKPADLRSLLDYLETLK